MTPLVSEAQFEKAVSTFRDLLRKQLEGKGRDVVQRVLGLKSLQTAQVKLLTRLVQLNSGLVERTVFCETRAPWGNFVRDAQVELAPSAMGDEHERLASLVRIPPLSGPAREFKVTFFPKSNEDWACQKLFDEYQERELRPASPQLILAVLRDDPNFLRQYSIGTQWHDNNRSVCSFWCKKGSNGRKLIDAECDRHQSHLWQGGWLFAGVEAEARE